MRRQWQKSLGGLARLGVSTRAFSTNISQRFKSLPPGDWAAWASVFFAAVSAGITGYAVFHVADDFSQRDLTARHVDMQLKLMDKYDGKEMGEAIGLLTRLHRNDPKFAIAWATASKENAKTFTVNSREESVAEVENARRQWTMFYKRFKLLCNQDYIQTELYSKGRTSETGNQEHTTFPSPSQIASFVEVCEPLDEANCRIVIPSCKWDNKTPGDCQGHPARLYRFLQREFLAKKPIKSEVAELNKERTEEMIALAPAKHKPRAPAQQPSPPDQQPSDDGQCRCHEIA